ncbi:hypothetical protein LHK_02401 [Laribacter hongkongensis HLHK9]|uniref:Uncharacterized protein n=2 Tax=Laribacter hongkongensis TaxID=168471 RepID=C1DB43_LARHH|nr:hypothetical protein LHK_02401 [Laribacter hongkongensis HLHK9]ASJ25299.1 hypothetical protein LHGZ1_2468 [Laribacter hongkongensis]
MGHMQAGKGFLREVKQFAIIHFFAKCAGSAKAVPAGLNRQMWLSWQGSHTGNGGNRRRQL